MVIEHRLLATWNRAELMLRVLPLDGLDRSRVAALVDSLRFLYDRLTNDKAEFGVRPDRAHRQIVHAETVLLSVAERYVGFETPVSRDQDVDAERNAPPPRGGGEAPVR